MLILKTENKEEVNHFSPYKRSFVKVNSLDELPNVAL